MSTCRTHPPIASKRPELGRLRAIPTFPAAAGLARAPPYPKVCSSNEKANCSFCSLLTSFSHLSLHITWLYARISLAMDRGRPRISQMAWKVGHSASSLAARFCCKLNYMCPSLNEVSGAERHSVSYKAYSRTALICLVRHVQCSAAQFMAFVSRIQRCFAMTAWLRLTSVRSRRYLCYASAHKVAP